MFIIKIPRIAIPRIISSDWILSFNFVGDREDFIILLAQTHSLIYKREMTLTLVYNYKVNNVGLIENDRRVLKRIT